MKKIVKTTERNWQCPYCSFLNDLSENVCKKCGAVRNGDEVEKEITTNFEETTVTETHEASGPVISTHHTISIILGVVLLLVAIVALVIAIPSSDTGSDTTKCTVISKDWEYTVSIGEYVMQTGITSYTKPPVDATNVTSKQVMQENGWYKTEYTYDYPAWQITRTETITGTGNAPIFNEYTISKESEKVMETSDVHYYVTVQTYLGTEKLPVSENMWTSIVVGNVYPVKELK